jgi:hypothetical protein
MSILNTALGNARDARMNNLTALMTDARPGEVPLTMGQKTTALLNAQSDLGITDGIQNLVAKVYNRWTQTGQ